MSEETLDTLVDGKLRLYQSRAGYRFSLDALLLAHFVTVKRGDRIFDLGAGNGPIALLLSHLHPLAALAGLEVQPEMAARAKRSVALNRLDDRVGIVTGDLREIGSIFTPSSFHVVVSNPPFRLASSGRISPNPEKQWARHEIKGGLTDFLAAAVYLLRPKGRLALIYSAERAVELLVSLRRAGLEPKRLRWVHSFAADRALLVLAEAVKGGRSGIEVEPPLVIYRKGKEYTVEVANIVAGIAKPSARTALPDDA
ncbi:MAG: tRNA1(Val) (adenine(37)-N6)-methyltransferase [Candidatus Binatia bacterium]